MQRILALALLLTMLLAPSRDVRASDAALQTHACTQGKGKVPATCGSLRVYENRTSQSGRQIDIHFVLLKATQPSGKVVYVNLGGPGSELGQVPAIADDAFLHELHDLRKDFDILFVDERGFGKSDSVACNAAPLNHRDQYFQHLWPANIVAACRAKDAQSADLAQYNTSNAVDDLDDLRAALGYDKLNFDVFSYGTFTSLVYMRQHSDHVGAVAMGGVAPPGIVNQVREFSNGAQSGFTGLVAECQHDAKCNNAFPHFREHFLALVQRLATGPLNVQIKNPLTKRIDIVAISREVFSDNMRHIFYAPDTAAFVPVLIEHAYRGDTRPLATAIDLTTQGFAQGIDGGAFLSYTCAEIMPFTDAPADSAYARTHSWYSDLRDRAQSAACKIWNVPAMPATFNQPVQSDAHVLMISGTDDPATPYYEGKEELKYLPNGKQMLVKNAPHDAESPCTDAAIAAFIRNGTANGIKLDACSANFKRPPFALRIPALLLP